MVSLPLSNFHSFHLTKSAMVVPALFSTFNSLLTATPSRPTPHLPSNSHLSQCRCSQRRPSPNAFTNKEGRLVSSISSSKSTTSACKATRKSKLTPPPQNEQQEQGSGILPSAVLQLLLWTAEAVYILWLFLLPYAPGDPVWAISSETITSLVGLSLNFFFILPLMNLVGIHVIEAPVLHPMSEGLFNFVIGWTFMFAPLLFTDCKRSRYKGSLDVLWGFQMFLTNTFLIPYMAIRLNEVVVEEYTSKEPSKFSALMVKGAPIVGLIGGAICLISTLWALFGRSDGGFGTVGDRGEFLISYLGSERLAYAFIWDIVLYLIFQPWLIGDNLQNVAYDKVGIVSKLRFIPVVGLAAYLVSLDAESEI